MANLAAVNIGTSPCAWHVSLPTEHSWFGLFSALGSLVLKPLFLLILCYALLCGIHHHLTSITWALSSHLDAAVKLGMGVWKGARLVGPWALKLLNQASGDSPMVSG